LDATEELEVREHAAGCAWCQAQLGEYAGLRDALRRHYGATELIPDEHVCPEEITRADVPPETSPGPHSGTVVLGVATRVQPRLAAAAALAAVLLVAVLVGSLFRWQAAPAGSTVVPGVGTLAAFPLRSADSHPTHIIAGSDGNLWFSEDKGLGRITPRGAITEF